MKMVIHMDIDLQNVPIRDMEYHGKITIPESYYQKIDIVGISPVDVKISIKKDLNQEDNLQLEAKGNLLLEDARTTETVEYPFQIDLTEKINEESEICGRFLEKSKNTLDILAILWENIVLEIPISYTLADELHLEGEGYQVSGKKSGENIDPRLAPLLELLDKEKE